jgi:hypothetical protein
LFVANVVISGEMTGISVVLVPGGVGSVGVTGSSSSTVSIMVSGS